MKAEIKIAIAVLIGFLSLLWLEKPLREYLSLMISDDVTAKLTSRLTIRIFLIALGYVLIERLRLITFNGLNSWLNFKNIQAVIIALSLILAGISNNWEIYINSRIEVLILFILSTFAVGFVEELTFRGTIFPLLIRSFKRMNQPILISAMLSSSMFGLVHFINVFSQLENIIGITSQVFFATAIGVFFCGLALRTENILIPCIIHGLINVGFSAGELNQTVKEISDLEEVSGINWNSLISTTIFFSFIFIGGIYMILKTDIETVYHKLY